MAAEEPKVKEEEVCWGSHPPHRMTGPEERVEMAAMDMDMESARCVYVGGHMLGGMYAAGDS